MNWDRLDLHLENLIPGTVLLAIVVIFWEIDFSPISNSPVAFGVAFVATAYMLGSIGNIVARFALDPVSAATVRPPMIRLLARRKISDIDDTSRAALNRRYSFLIDQAMTCGSDLVVKEVLKRRQTARLCRSALVPVLLIVMHLVHGRLAFAATAVAYAVMLVLYAYSEVAIFAESHRAFRIKLLIRDEPKAQQADAPNKRPA